MPVHADSLPPVWHNLHDTWPVQSGGNSTGVPVIVNVIINIVLIDWNNAH